MHISSCAHFSLVNKSINSQAPTHPSATMKMPRFRPLLPWPFTSYPTPTSHCYTLHNIPSWITTPDGRERAPLVSSRWNPSAEQVQVLERQGTRAPSAAEIHQIVARLRRFGKVEAKNVFYWFQNHKARDRQKHAQIPRRKPSGSSTKYSVNAHPKKSSTLSDYSTNSKYYESMHGAMVQEKKQKVSNDEKGREEENPYYPFAALNLCKMLPPKHEYFRNSESGNRENQTLELFPGRGIIGLSRVEEETDDDGTRFVPNQFFEFLPTKI